MNTTHNTYVRTNEVAAVSGSVAAVKAEILRLAAVLFAREGYQLELSHERGSVFSLFARNVAPTCDVTGHYVAEMPLRRMCAWLRVKSAEHRRRTEWEVRS